MLHHSDPHVHLELCSCSCREVELKSLSPVLSQLAASPIPVPGLTPAQASKAPSSHKSTSNASEATQSLPYQISSAELVTVAAFKQSVHVMSTKTRPKRIGMIGSDGRTYTFLLKVRECQTSLALGICCC